ncbi:MAG: hypothetical protein QOJ88_50 [Pyrinomonadaceae bacterium]|nr:hypothetical protein [Pyrinomonadaceae bacterium]
MKKRSFLTSNTSLSLCVLFIISVTSLSALGQSSTSAVRGVVRDPQGNVVAGATVTLINPGTNASRTTSTSGDGVFTFEQVPVGDYRIEATAKGFKKAVTTEVHALVSKVTPVDIQLEIGNVTETVVVTTGAGEALVNRDDGSLGNNFVNQQITQLPLEARNVLSLVTLQPGVTPDGYVTGARSDQSNITLDGIDINEAQSNSIDSPVLRLNSEAIEEFRVTTSNPNADQGRSSGAQISLITKSGTNDWHGALFEAHRNTIFTANDFFNNRNGRYVATDAAVILGTAKVGDLRNPRPKLLRNTFGGALGGPIIKDKFFFFYSFEARRDAAQSTVVRVVPLASLGRGELRYVNPSGGITTLNAAQLQTIFTSNGNTVGVNPTAFAALSQAAAKYPANDFTVGDSTLATQLNTAGFRFNANTPVALNSHTARFDLKLNEKHTLFLRANVIYDKTGVAPRFPDTPAVQDWSHPWGFVAGHTWALSNSVVNNFRYGFTREAFTNPGDSTQNSISFRFVFQPLNFSRTRSRTTPVQNLTDDLSWVRGSHTLQFGANVRIIRNHSVDFSSSFDNASANPSFYAGGAGAAQSNAVNAFSPIGTGYTSTVQNAVTALIGRFSQYSGVFSFNIDGSLKQLGQPNIRNFATEEYDGYVQDVWKVKRNLTITGGLRYSLSHPVYETQGFEVKTNIPLGDYFDKRVAAAAAGSAFNDPLTVELSGKANHKSPLYNWDKNNFQPRIAVAWSPRFKHGLLASVLGKDEQSVFRGAFSITNDYYGEQLAVSFDLNNTIGFVSSQTTAANTFNLTSRQGPLFTGFGQAVRTFPCSPRFCISIPAKVTFPNQQPADEAPRIESSLDSRLVAPINYSWNFTYERQLPKGLHITASYVGRYAKHLIATRDVMALNNLVDKKSGMDWYTAATKLELLRANGTDISAVAPIPYFENLWPGLGASEWGDPSLSATQAVYKIATDFFGNDWTDTQFEIDDQGIFPNMFFQPQYGALATFSSIGHSWYHGGTLTVRERLNNSLSFDFNYTLSHSLDDASGLQTSGGYGAAFILNPLRQHDWYADSDFDYRHIINMNAIWQLPVGRGRWLFNDANKWVNGFIGGWQLSGIYRWNSGLPYSAPYDDARWATNWNAQSYNVRVGPIDTCPTRGGVDSPKLFGCNTTAAYRSFRNARPGESGDRAPFRLPGYVSLDLGLSKEFKMPWGENHKLQLRWEVFNVTNTQRLGSVDASRTGYGITADPGGRPYGCVGAACVPQDGTGDGTQATPPTNWSNFTAIQGTPRVMQFGLRYSF